MQQNVPSPVKEEEEPQELEPPIFASIQQVLSEDRAYADEVIAAVKQLPVGEQDLLQRLDFGPVPSPVTDVDDFTDSAAHEPVEGDSEESSSTNRGTGQAQGSDQAGSSHDSSENPLKRKESPNGDGGQGNGRDGNKAPGNRRKQNLEGISWRCPFSEMFSDISDKVFYRSCRSPGYWAERSEWL